MKILETMTEEYIEDMLARLAHHSSAIEGNTLSYNQTVSIVLNRTIPSGSNINIREFYEVENHRYALEYILGELKETTPLNLSILKEINNKLMDHLNDNKGSFKVDSNAIKGADFQTARPQETPSLIYQWIENLNFKLENSKTEEEKIKIILEEHIQFERIHPFSDGNGRTGRMLMLYSMLEHNLTPFIIPVEEKGNYYTILGNQHVESFYHLVEPLRKKEEERREAFYNKEKSTIKEGKNP